MLNRVRAVYRIRGLYPKVRYFSVSTYTLQRQVTHNGTLTTQKCAMLGA